MSPSAPGQVLLKAHVEEVLVDGGRAAGVRLKDGRVIRAPTVVRQGLSSNTLHHRMSVSVSFLSWRQCRLAGHQVLDQGKFSARAGRLFEDHLEGVQAVEPCL